MKKDKSFSNGKKKDNDSKPSGIINVRGRLSYMHEIWDDEAIPSGIIIVRGRFPQMYKISSGKKSTGACYFMTPNAKKMRKRTNARKTRIKLETKKNLKTEEDS